MKRFAAFFLWLLLLFGFWAKQVKVFLLQIIGSLCCISGMTGSKGPAVNDTSPRALFIPAYLQRKERNGNMVIIVKQNTKEERIRELIQWIESQNLRTHISTGDFSTVIGVIGDTSKLDEDLISGLDIVEGVKRVSEPFKSANRKFHPSGLCH